MQNFTTFSGPNLGGCKSFLFIPINDISSIPDPVDMVISSAVVLRSGKSWYTGYSTLETLEFAERQKNTRAGSSFDKIINGSYPKQSNSMLALFNEMDGQRFVIQITDNNDVVRLVGTINNPLIFRFDFTTGQQAANLNGYKFVFEQEDTDPAPVYSV